MFRTRITELLNIRYPILMGAMHHITLADMAAAAANAGCIGFIPAASFSDPEKLRREIKRARDLADGPIGVNVSMLPNTDPGALTMELVEVGIDQRVGAFETAGRSPDEMIGRIKGARIPLIHKVPQVKYARRAERIGADAVTILGFEGAGFVGTGEVGGLVLVNRAARRLSIPVIAGGGIVDGRGLVAALALGAEGVLMGTRFLASKEAPVSERLKEWMRGATENDTMVLFGSLATPIRSIRNEAARRLAQMEADGASMEQILAFAGQRARLGTAAETIDELLFSVGEGVGLIDEVKTVKDIVSDIVSEAGKVTARLNALMGARP